MMHIVWVEISTQLWGSCQPTDDSTQAGHMKLQIMLMYAETDSPAALSGRDRLCADVRQLGGGRPARPAGGGKDGGWERPAWSAQPAEPPRWAEHVERSAGVDRP